MKQLVTLLIFVFAAHACFADDTTSSPCQPSEALQQFLVKYKINTWTEQDLCDENSVYLRIFHAVEYMESLNSRQDPQSSLVVSQEGAGNYFEKRISTIIVDDMASSFFCAVGGTVAYVHNLQKNTMHICPDAMQNYPSTLLSSYVLIHEARHTEGYPHALCTHGFFASYDKTSLSSGSCDHSLEQQGSYGVATGFLLEMYRASENLLVRQEARARVVADLVQHFNQLPLDAKEGMLIQNTQGKIAFFDGETSSPLLELKNSFVNPGNTIVSLRFESPVFYNPEGAVKGFKFSPNLSDADGIYASNYRQKFSPEERKNMVDIYFGIYHDYSCMLFVDKLSCGDNYSDADDLDIPITGFRPRNFVFSGNSNVLQSKALYILSEGGDLYALPKDWVDFMAKAKDFSWEKISYKYNISSVAEVAGTEYGVDTSHRLLRYSPVKDQWEPTAEFENQEIKKILGPFYWSQKIQDL